MKSSPPLKHRADHPTLQLRTHLAALPPAARKHLQKLRQAIREAAPGAVGTSATGCPPSHSMETAVPQKDDGRSQGRG